MNAGFSWVRIDKGNIHCNFRYLNLEQVQTVLDYLKSYYEYQNVNFGIVDLGAAGVLQESGDHYRPSGADLNLDYYFLVEIHRHGTIIPQGSIEILKNAINALTQHQIIPESVFIKKLKTNMLTVGEEASLEAISVKSSASDITWATSDVTIVSITPDGADCDIVAEAPGEAIISASVVVQEAGARELPDLPKPTSLWCDNVYKYTGTTKANPWNKTTQSYTDPLTNLTHDAYYECEYDDLAPGKYIWKASSYDGSPLDVTYRSEYNIVVRTYITITTKDVQRLCLYHYLQLEAMTPSTGLVPVWSLSSDTLEFDSGVASGDTVVIHGIKTGNNVVKVSLTDTYGTYEDSLPMEVFALDVTPNTLKLVTGATGVVSVARANIFDDDPEEVHVEWVTSNADIADVLVLDPPTDPTTNFTECQVSAQGIGSAYVTAIAEDPLTGISYTDSTKITVGNVAIVVPPSAVIYLLSSTKTLTIQAILTAGFAIDASTGWVSSNPEVLAVTSVSGDSNRTVVVTGLTEGTSLLTCTAVNGAATDTDSILIKVVDAEYVTTGEMLTFTHGMFDGHGVVDWDHPTGEDGTMEVDEDAVELVTEPEVEDFVEDLFDGDSEEEETEESDDSEDPGDGE